MKAGNYKKTARPRRTTIRIEMITGIITTGIFSVTVTPLITEIMETTIFSVISGGGLGVWGPGGLWVGA